MSTGALVPIRVLAAVIERDGRFLVCQRPAHKRHGGLWEFPGGKLEAGETLADAAKRELNEELAVRATSLGDPIFVAQDPGSVFTIEFVPVSIDGSPRCLEHSALKWATTPELERLDLAPADRQFVSFLLNRA